MKNYLFLAGFLAIFFTACQRDPPPPNPELIPNSSTWVVNTNTFNTYNGQVNHGPSSTTLSGSSDNSDSSSFFLSFHLPTLPQQGDYLLNCGLTDSFSACLEIDYLGFHYYPNTNQPLYIHAADTVNGKALLKLSNPILFLNELNPNETIIVSGTFRQP